MKFGYIILIFVAYNFTVDTVKFTRDDPDVRVTVNDTFYYFLSEEGSYWIPGTKSWIKMNMNSHPYIDHLNQYLQQKNKPNNATSYQTPQTVGANARRAQVLPITQSTTTKKPIQTTIATTKATTTISTTRATTTTSTTKTPEIEPILGSVNAQSNDEMVGGKQKIKALHHDIFTSEEMVGARTTIIGFIQTTPKSRYTLNQESNKVFVNNKFKVQLPHRK